MSNHDSLISDFVNITAVDAERAKFYLESSAWQLEVALASFYENDTNDQPAVEDIPDDQSSSPPTVSEPKGKSRGQSSGRFATVHNLSSSDSDEEGQAFYAGGSEHSGQQILGPSKHKKDFVSEMFKSVKEHGAEIVEPTSPSRVPAFTGVGYKLGQSSQDSEMVSGRSRPAPQHTDITLKLWRDGFSVNDGEIRAYTDPLNKEFLESIKKGEIPQELIREARGSEVHLNMEDHRHEEFIHTKPKFQAFSGKGHTLGSPTPSAVSTCPIPEVSKDATVTAEQQASQQLAVDQAQPVTNVQIRLADGTRLIAVFNHTHTVADIRRYIIAARPQYEGRQFNLLSTFPSRELVDSQSLSEAGLLNSAILQRLV